MNLNLIAVVQLHAGITQFTPPQLITLLEVGGAEVTTISENSTIFSPKVKRDRTSIGFTLPSCARSRTYRVEAHYAWLVEAEQLQLITLTTLDSVASSGERINNKQHSTLR